jgi:hypothetical protein
MRPVLAVCIVGAFLNLLAWTIVVALCWMCSVIGEGIARATWRGE